MLGKYKAQGSQKYNYSFAPDALSNTKKDISKSIVLYLVLELFFFMAHRMHIFVKVILE